MITIEIKNSKKVNSSESAFLSFTYDKKILDIIRAQIERYWIADIKQWEIPLHCLGSAINKLSAYEITLIGEISEGNTQEGEVIQKIELVKPPNGFEFKTKCFQHQLECFSYGMQKDKFLLGDEQGLGKTKQIIDIAVAKKIDRDYKHCLIVCGVNGLKYNWQKEIAIHSNEKGYILGTRTNKKGKIVIGGNKEKLHDLNDIGTKIKDYFIITNVESLRDETILTVLKAMCDKGKLNMIAFDEIHKCKNSATTQGKALLKLETETMIAATGTALMNTPLDLYVPLKWLGYEKHSFYAFKNHYAIMNGYIISGYKNLSEIREKLNNIMLRRLKKDVLNLPAKIHQTEYVEMCIKQTKIYKEVVASIIEEIDKIKISPNPLAQLIRLRQATGYTGILSTEVKESAKLDRMEEIVEELTEQGEKIIIFSNWEQITQEVTKRLKEYNPAIITGRTKDRETEKDKFMTNDNCKVIVGTIGAMGTGLTLTEASTVIFLDEPWTKATKDQAEDRAHRIGTKGSVKIITLITKDTIDERINELVETKGAMAEQMLDGKISSNDKSKLIDFLLE
jgi:SNF2 family DNA or RNA helicase